MDTNFTIKSENIYRFEVETNDAFAKANAENPDFLTEEQINDIMAHNDDFQQTVLIPYLRRYATPCQCVMEDIARRAMENAKVLTLNNRQTITIEQEDIDQTIFSPLLICADGKYQSIDFLTCQCKRCGRISMYGSIILVARAMAEAYVNHVNSHADVPSEAVPEEEAPARSQCESCLIESDLNNPEYVLENAETGDICECDGLTGDPVAPTVE